MEKPVRILITDDHQMFIDGLKSILRKQDTFQVTAEALDGFKALEILEKQETDILITDISMPGMSGIELTKIVKEKYPHVKVIVVTMHNDPGMVSEILQAEAEGYILKNTGKKELIEALTKVSGNGTFYSNEVLTLMLQSVKSEKKPAEETKHLSEREIEILKLIVEEYYQQTHS